ncbi:MAG TPA: carboxypeptidase-like regulatory domain-containing protein [Planctomycetota bacterium]|nr:carboxypeptidase-like regulatory domain-containing protein [Planctomycetota bacterium]
MQRLALIFTVLVFSLVIGGLLWRHGSKLPAARPDFTPSAAVALPHLVDPLAVVPPAGAARADRLALRVVDPAGAAVAGAALVVRASKAPIWAFTAADGTATLEGLSPGTSRLAVLAFPHPGLELDIEPGPEVREIALEAKATLPARLADIPRSRFAGSLRASDAEPLADFEILLLPVAAASELGGALPRRGVSDHAGRFAFDGLAHGRYLIKVLPAWASGGSWPDLVAEKSRELEFSADIVEGQVELARGGIEGEVRDDLRRALEGALVLVNQSGNETHIWPPSSSGPDGRFRIQDLPPGKYRVSCRAGEGGSAIDELDVIAGAPTWAALPSFAARKRP